VNPHLDDCYCIVAWQDTILDLKCDKTEICLNTFLAARKYERTICVKQKNIKLDILGKKYIYYIRRFPSKRFFNTKTNCLLK